MQWLSLVPEDAGVQRLRAERPVTASTGQLDRVAHYPSSHPVQIGETHPRAAAPRRERRRGERRQGERRGQQLAGAFDTRGKHDRRGCQDRLQSTVAAATPKRAAHTTGLEGLACLLGQAKKKPCLAEANRPKKPKNRKPELRRQAEVPEWQAQLAAQQAARVAQDNGMREVDIFVKGPGPGREAAIRSLQSAGLIVTSITDVTPIPHNGCRPPKRRRV